MLVGAPGRWTQEDVQLASSPGVRGRHDLSDEDLEGLRREYFAQPRACMRASPLPKTFGWGLHYNAEGRITLHAVNSEEYAQYAAIRLSISYELCGRAVLVAETLLPRPFPCRVPIADP